MSRNFILLMIYFGCYVALILDNITKDIPIKDGTELVAILFLALVLFLIIYAPLNAFDLLPRRKKGELSFSVTKFLTWITRL